MHNSTNSIKSRMRYKHNTMQTDILQTIDWFYCMWKFEAMLSIFIQIKIWKSSTLPSFSYANFSYCHCVDAIVVDNDAIKRLPFRCFQCDIVDKWEFCKRHVRLCLLEKKKTNKQTETKVQTQAIWNYCWKSIWLLIKDSKA